MTSTGSERKDDVSRPAGDTVESPVESECFVICPIGASDSDTRKRSDQILKHVISPPAAEFGLKVLRSDRLDQSGSITTQIINHVLNAQIVVADLTDHNPNVFYELALRHAAAKPFIQLIQAGQTIPFDIANYRTVFIDHRDLDSAAEARESISKMLRDSEEAGSARVDTPITQAVDFEGLRASGDPQQREIAHLSVQMRQLTNMVARVSTFGEANPDEQALREFVVSLAATGRLNEADKAVLVTTTTSESFDRWVRSLRIPSSDPWGNSQDPWATPSRAATEESKVPDDPPF